MLGRKRRLKNRSKALLYPHAVEAPHGLKKAGLFPFGWGSDRHRLAQSLRRMNIFINEMSLMKMPITQVTKLDL